MCDHQVRDRLSSLPWAGLAAEEGGSVTSLSRSVCVSLLPSRGAWKRSEVLPEGEAPPPGVQVRANAERKQSRDGESLNEKDKGFV